MNIIHIPEGKILPPLYKQDPCHITQCAASFQAIPFSNIIILRLFYQELEIGLSAVADHVGQFVKRRVCWIHLVLF